MSTSAISRILVIDVGGTNVKVLSSPRETMAKIPSGLTMSPATMVKEIQASVELAGYSRISIGYPGQVIHGKPVSEPHNLASGWMGFDFSKAFRRPVKVINDAALQALGSYQGGRMLFLGLGTGLGSALIVEGVVEPMELAHLPYKRHSTYEDFVGNRGLKRLGKQKWRQHVLKIILQLKIALQADYVVLGGGNARLLKNLPKGVLRGQNSNAFEGGRRLWEDPSQIVRQCEPKTDKRKQEVSQKPSVKVVPDTVALWDSAATHFRSVVAEAIKSKGFFAVALAGGSTPRSLYSALASDSVRNAELQWDKCFFFWGDERPVGPDSQESNFRMATETLLSRLPVQPTQVFRIPAEHPDLAHAAREYEQTLSNFFKLEPGELPRFDLALLGMGPEGHTASLFPGTDVLDETQRLVVETWVGKFGTTRITMTVPVFNNSAHVMFLVSGEKKAPVLKSVLEGPYVPRQLPAQLIRPRRGALLWLVDKAAGSLLQNSQHPEVS